MHHPCQILLIIIILLLLLKACSDNQMQNCQNEEPITPINCYERSTFTFSFG